MKNIDIRVMVAESGLRYKDIAAELGISPEWLSKLLRYTLSPDNKARIVAAIEKMKGESDG